MSEETTQKELGPKKHLSKNGSIGVMVAGGLMILIPWFFFPAEQGSALQIAEDDRRCGGIRDPVCGSLLPAVGWTTWR